jgi:hypothetical protein
MKEIGNKKAAEKWELHMPPYFARPMHTDSAYASELELVSLCAVRSRKNLSRPSTSGKTLLRKFLLLRRYRFVSHSSVFHEHISCWLVELTETLQAALLSKEGWLVKQGKVCLGCWDGALSAEIHALQVVKSWKKRWFSLKGTVVSYSKKQKDDLAAGEIFLNETSKYEDRTSGCVLC